MRKRNFIENAKDAKNKRRLYFIRNNNVVSQTCSFDYKNKQISFDFNRERYIFRFCFILRLSRFKVVEALREKVKNRNRNCSLNVKFERQINSQKHSY